ncbi:MAG: hypothetical protein GXO39_03695 [Thermotogae bacterium]|nr:hypothetical protein [Thermotogota bacterium]
MKKIRHTLDFVEPNPDVGKLLINGYPYTYRSAFLNQYFEDAVRTSHPTGREILYYSSLFANYRVLKVFADRSDDPQNFLDVSESFFMSMGYGRPVVESGAVKLISSPIAQTYLYLNTHPSTEPVCNFQRGYVSASLSLALDAEPGDIYTEESECVAMHDPICRMIPKRWKGRERGDEVRFPKIDYARLDYYREDNPDFFEKIALLRKAIPAADDTGNIYIPSAYGGLRRAAYMFFPSDYFSYATWRVLEEGDRDTADLMIKFTGYSGFLMTFVSLYYTPIGKVAYGNPETPEELFGAILSSMKYWGMGFWKPREIKDGEVTVSVHNFYENDFQRLVGVSKPYSPYVVGGLIGLLFAIYRVKFYLQEDPMFIGDVLKSYDEALELFKTESDFVPEENAQVVSVRW